MKTLQYGDAQLLPTVIPSMLEKGQLHLLPYEPFMGYILAYWEIEIANYFCNLQTAVESQF